MSLKHFLTEKIASSPRGQKGNLLIGVLFLMVLILIIPLVIKSIIPEVDLVYKLVLIFGVYAFVAQMMQGTGTLTLLITGVLVYFIAFKYSDIFVSLWFVTVVITMVGGTLLVTAARDFLGFGADDEPGGGAGHAPH